MPLTLASLLVLSWCGHTAVQRAGRLSGLKFDGLLSWGLGFFISAALMTQYLRLSPLSITWSSWILILTGSLALSASIYKSQPSIGIKHLTAFISASPREMVLLGLLALYLGVIAVSQTSKDIFAWDAFTTWMYRAKLWVLEDYSISLDNVPEWLRQGAVGYSIEASNYPISVSAIAAFASSVSGGWRVQAAATPWLFAIIASAALMMGLIRKVHGEKLSLPLMGALLLVSTPVFHVHGLLAGYADLWVQGTSGMGLAALCAWSQKRERVTLLIGLMLLVLGIFFKHEGWLWLCIGLASVAILTLSHKKLVLTFALILIGVVAFSVLAEIDLGATRTWGYANNTLLFGQLGEIKLRPENNLGVLFSELILRGNFLFLVPLYLALTAWSILRKERQFIGHWLIGCAVLICLVFIFCLSSYSIYAELGTVFNRIFLQVLPVLVVTICSIGDHYCKCETASVTGPRQIKMRGSITQGLAWLALSLSASVVLTPWFWPDATLPQKNDAAETQKFHPAEEMQSILGTFQKTGRGHQFTDPNVAVGVTAANIHANTVQPRYVYFDVKVAEPNSLSFYWINTQIPTVHSFPISLSGSTVVDLSRYTEFWQLPIREMGYIAKPENFNDVVIYSMGQSDDLTAAHLQLVNLWGSPAQLSQKAINGIDGHTASPINFNTILNISFAALVGVIAVSKRLNKHRFKLTISTITVTVAGLWIIGSALYLHQALAFTQDLIAPSNLISKDMSISNIRLERLERVSLELERVLSNTKNSMGSVDEEPNTPNAANLPILSIGNGPSGNFDAHKLPFAVLPRPAAKIHLSHLTELPPGTSAILVVFDVKLLEDPNLSSLPGLTLERLSSGLGKLYDVELFRLERK